MKFGLLAQFFMLHGIDRVPMLKYHLLLHTAAYCSVLLYNENFFRKSYFTRLYKSPCRSVRPSVGPSHFAFFAFFGFLKVGKHIFQFFLSNKQHLQSLFLDQSVNKSFCWLVGLSVDWLKFVCFHIFRFVWCKTIMN